MYKLTIFKSNEIKCVQVAKTKDVILSFLEGQLFLQKAINKDVSKIDIFIDRCYFKDGLLTPSLNKKGVYNCCNTNVIFNPTQTDLEVENLVKTTVEYFKEKLP
jgi:hypothetical protein